MSGFIPFAIPDIGEEECNEVLACLRSGWITSGPRTEKFENDFKAYIGSKYALAVNSATAGLHLALDAIGLKAGDKVITSPYTFTATAEVIRYFGADPVFCDIDPDTYNMDPKKLEALVKKTLSKPNHNLKAIIPVHMAGQSCDLDPIMKLAKDNGLKVIHDAAHALPSTYNGKLLGTFGDITVFSFYATKNIATGEGGMVVTDNKEYMERIQIMRLHGINKFSWDRYNSNKMSWYYEVVAPGYKYNMTDISASLGIHQLKKLDKFFIRRNEIADTYTKEFSKIMGITTPKLRDPNDKHCYHLYLIKIDPKIRNSFIEKMQQKGVQCSVHFIPLHIHPYWAQTYKLKENDYPCSVDAFNRTVSLPLYTKMSDADINKVVETTIGTLRELS